MVGFGRGVIMESPSPAPARITPELLWVSGPSTAAVLGAGLSPMVTILQISAMGQTKGAGPAPAEM